MNNFEPVKFKIEMKGTNFFTNTVYQNSLKKTESLQPYSYFKEISVVKNLPIKILSTLKSW